jgi:prophage regulatory protein
MKVLSYKQVRELVLFSRQHWDRLIAEGKAPRPIRLGEHRVGWLEDEVHAWLKERIEARDRQLSE